MSLVIMTFAFLTLLLIVINIMIVRRVIKIDLKWHRTTAYIVLACGLIHSILVFIYYIEDLSYILPLILGGFITYIVLIIQVLIGKSIIKAGIKVHRILGYIILLFGLLHMTLALLTKFGLIQF